MKNKKVSIIVPVYNAEPFLEKLFDSLINQTYKNIEIVLINDGSKDKSLNLLKEFQKKHPKIVKVYTHSNMGVGKTRNRGIELCTGEYITFVDADDYIDYDFIETLMGQIGGNDIIVSGYQMVENDKIVYTRILNESSGWAKFQQGIISAKIFLKSFLIENDLAFSTLKIAEDICFSMNCYSRTNKVCCTSYVGYSYVQHKNSAMHNIELLRSYDIKNLLNSISEQISDNKSFTHINLKFIQYFYIKTIANFYVVKAKYCAYEELQEYNDIYMSWYKQECKKNNWKFSFIYEKAEPFYINLAINLLILFEKLHFGKVSNRLASKFFYKSIK